MWTQRRSGETNQRSADDQRNPYEHDKTRVIHCPAFRRLQKKTQILGTHEGDFHRTRLTHSLEVASIGNSIARNIARQTNLPIPADLLPHEDCIQTICLLHDIGHPPFGHGGEVALNYMMQNHGGFESNAQTLRLLTKVENSYGPFGLDLTRRSLLGLLKYPVERTQALAPELPVAPVNAQKPMRINDWTPPKAYFASEQSEVDWLLSPFSASDRLRFQTLAKAPQGLVHGVAAYQSFDCSIMNTADDIAYGVHDLEDAIHLQLIQRMEIDTPEWHDLVSETTLYPEKNTLLDLLFSQEIAARKEAISKLVNYFITATHITTTDAAFENPLLRYNITLKPEAERLLAHLVAKIYQLVIDSQEARTFEYGGQSVILRLFEALASNPNSLLDKKNRILYNAASFDEPTAFRVICDYIANMTDEYAYRLHERLFGFRAFRQFIF